jgi:hypothetical protein
MQYSEPRRYLLAVPGADSLAEDNIRWMKTEVDCLPQVFASVNKNFISVAIEYLLAMARVAANCRVDILLGVQDVKRAA